jgi:rhodanese-related sulfurtransferase
MARRKVVGTIIAALLLGGGAAFLAVRRAGDLTPQQAHQLVEGGALLVDVRSPAEFAAGHLPGALNVPVHEIQARDAELGPRDRPLVLYCRSGTRSAHAAETLRQAGHTAVHNLGAMSRW